MPQLAAPTSHSLYKFPRKHSTNNKSDTRNLPILRPREKASIGLGDPFTRCPTHKPEITLVTDKRRGLGKMTHWPDGRRRPFKESRGISPVLWVLNHIPCTLCPCSGSKWPMSLDPVTRVYFSLCLLPGSQTMDSYQGTNPHRSWGQL